MNRRYSIHRHDGWFRLWHNGPGIRWKDTTVVRLTFSERQGRSLCVGPWLVRYLPPRRSFGERLDRAKPDEHIPLELHDGTVIGYARIWKS